MKRFTKLGSFIFAVISLAHLLRLIVHFQIMIGSHAVPLWVSAFGFIIAAVISGGLWRESR
jgi:hypothetical protein